MSERTFTKVDDEVELEVKHIKPGMVLACPVYKKDGEILQTAYTPFTKDFLDQLLQKDITTIYYSNRKSDKNRYNHTLKEYIQTEQYKGPRKISLETQTQAIYIMDKIETTIRNRLPATFIDETKDIIYLINLELFNKVQGNIINLLNIEDYDDLKYSHSLNVAIISMDFAKLLNKDEDSILDIGLAGFLHDIGKMRIPYHIVNKKDQLSSDEYQIIQEHSRKGYEIVKDCKNLSDFVKETILTHHEKYDGTGYPLGLKEDQIDDGVYILSLSETFDALTSDSSYKKSFSLQSAFNLIIQESGKRFKPELAHLFVTKMHHLYKESSYYPIGSIVKLNTREMALVIEKDNDLTSRPVVEVFKNPRGEKIRPITINLKVDGSRYIERILKRSSAN